MCWRRQRGMGGGESSSSSFESGGGVGMGSQMELINSRNAQLYLIDGEESVLMQSGVFALKMLKQTHSPLAVVVANVGEVQWPVGKDAPALKVWTRRYTFSLPGLVYGLILPNSCPTSVLQHLESILAQYCAFEVHREIANLAQHQYTASPGGGDVSGYWTALAPEVETMSSRVAQQIGSTSTIVANSIVMGGDWAALGIKQGESLLKRKGPDSPIGDGGVSPRMMKRMQQARRMSAVAKLVSRTLLKGAISASGHVSRTLGVDVNVAATGSTFGNEENTRNVAVASVDAFGKVVEAVETAGKSIYGVTKTVGADLAQEKFGCGAGQVVQDGLGAVGSVINTAWTLNKMGVKMLLRVTAASTALNLRSGTRSSATVTPSPVDEQTITVAATSVHSLPKNEQRGFVLQHQITLSQQQHDPVQLNLLPSIASNQPLQTSQLFPTSAEQMRTQALASLPPPSMLNPFMPSGNLTSFVPPGPRPSSPFQQYSRHNPHPQTPFSFPDPNRN